MTGISIGRRISFAVVFALLSIAIISQALRAGSIGGTLILGWFAADAMTLCIAYTVNWPRVFGKTDQGALRWVHALYMGPFLIFVRLVWNLQNAFSRSPLYNEVVPDLFVGRICEFSSLLDGIALFVDLTAEFPTPHSIQAKVPTICLPTLDGCPPDWEKCRQVYEMIGMEHPRIYVCCANGHGRSVTFAAAWLGYSRICNSPTDAVKRIQASRPSAAPNQDQISFLKQAFQSMNPI